MDYKILCRVSFLLSIGLLVYNTSLAQKNTHRCIFIGGPNFYIEPKTKITWADFNEFLASKINYPRQVREQGQKGIVKVRFVINEEGKLTNIEVLDSFNEQCKAAVLDALRSKKASEWKHIGTPKKVIKEFTVEFKLGPKFKKG